MITSQNIGTSCAAYHVSRVLKYHLFCKRLRVGNKAWQLTLLLCAKYAVVATVDNRASEYITSRCKLNVRMRRWVMILFVLEESWGEGSWELFHVSSTMEYMIHFMQRNDFLVVRARWTARDPRTVVLKNWWKIILQFIGTFRTVWYWPMCDERCTCCQMGKWANETKSATWLLWGAGPWSTNWNQEASRASYSNRRS